MFIYFTYFIPQAHAAIALAKTSAVTKIYIKKIWGDFGEEKPTESEWTGMLKIKTKKKFMPACVAMF